MDQDVDEEYADEPPVTPEKPSREEIPPPTPSTSRAGGNAGQKIINATTSVNSLECQTNSADDPDYASKFFLPLKLGIAEEEEKIAEGDGGVGENEEARGGACSPATPRENEATRPPVSEGSMSPASSQGSMDSIEFLYKSVRSIERRTDAVNGSDALAALTRIPQNVHKLLEKFVTDPYQRPNLLNFLRMGIQNMAFQSNEVQPGTEAADQLVKTINGLDSDALIATAGRYCMCSIHVTTDDAFPVANFPLDPPSGREYSPGPGMEERIPGPSPRKKIKLENEMPAVDIPVQPPAFDVDEEIWERAYDQLVDETDERRQIEKIGQVFFSAIMTPEEIKTQTFSGKGNTGKFAEIKTRWIRAACAFIWMKPPRNERNTGCFELKYNKGLDLDTTLWSIVKKRVFSEYAYRERRRIKSEEGVEAVSNAD